MAARVPAETPSYLRVFAPATSDDEFLITSSEARGLNREGIRRSALAALAGVVLLGACAALVALGAVHAPEVAKNAAPAPAGSMRALLESPEAIETATNQLLESTRRDGIAAPSKDLMRASVAEAFQNITRRLQAVSPKGADTPWLSRDQTAAVLRATSLASDVRFQRIGLEVARAVRQSKEGDVEDMRRNILAKLRPRLAELRQLHAEVSLGGQRHPGLRIKEWSEMLHPQKERMLRSFDDAWANKLEKHAAAALAAEDRLRGRRLQMTPAQNPMFAAAPSGAAPGTAPGVGSSMSPDRMQFMASIMNEGKMLLDQFKVFVEMFGANMDLPEPLRVFLDASGYFVQLAECGLGAVAKGMSASAMMMCPLELGEQGMEAVTKVIEMVGGDASDFGFGSDGAKASQR